MRLNKNQNTIMQAKSLPNVEEGSILTLPFVATKRDKYLMRYSGDKRGDLPTKIIDAGQYISFLVDSERFGVGGKYTLQVLRKGKTERGQSRYITFEEEGHIYNAVTFDVVSKTIQSISQVAEEVLLFEIGENSNGFSKQTSSKRIWKQNVSSDKWIIPIANSEFELTSCKCENTRIDKKPFLNRIEEQQNEIIVYFNQAFKGIAKIRI